MRRHKGFTLIEVLVVIGIISLLMSIFLPSLERVRREARAIKCQSNIKQWSLVWSAFLDDNDGTFGHISFVPCDANICNTNWWNDYYLRPETEGIRLCPNDTEIANPTGELPTIDCPKKMCGGKYISWGRYGRAGTRLYGAYGSYGANNWLNEFYCKETLRPQENYWKNTEAMNPGDVPMWFDCSVSSTWFNDYYDPPPSEERSEVFGWEGGLCVINQHDGNINCLFMDWSVRKTGLKELWTLKWHRNFNTMNEWTLAGGVQSADWPDWIRQYKDF